MSAPDPRDVIAAVLDDVGWISSRDAASEAIDALTAAGLRVVPEDRPTCPKCGAPLVDATGDWQCHPCGMLWPADSPDLASPVPDDDTRREVEARMDWLDRASKAIYLEVPAAVGDDVAAGMQDARRLLAAHLGGGSDA